MNKKAIYSFAVSFLLAIALLMPHGLVYAAASDGGEAVPVVCMKADSGKETPKISNTKISLNVGGTKKLKVTGTTEKVKWSSSDKKVASVSSSGKVTAKKAGTATITAKAGKKKLTCKVTVKEADDTKADTVYITDTGKKYHKSGCRYLKKSNTGISLEKAKEMGYTPCSACH